MIDTSSCADDKTAVAVLAEAIRGKLLGRVDDDVVEKLLGTPAIMERLSGRVCRGGSHESFRSLHPDGVEVKPWSWVVAADGLTMLLGGPLDAAQGPGPFVLQKFRKLGFVDSWVRKKLLDGERFRLALFPRAAAFPATLSATAGG